MSAEPAVEHERALEINQAITPHRPEICSVQGLSEDIERKLFAANLRNRQATAVHRDAVTFTKVASDTRRSDLQLGPSMR